MKLSYHTSKVLMSVSISALLSSAALAQEITIADGDGSYGESF